MSEFRSDYINWEIPVCEPCNSPFEMGDMGVVEEGGYVSKRRIKIWFCPSCGLMIRMYDGECIGRMDIPSARIGPSS